MDIPHRLLCIALLLDAARVIQSDPTSRLAERELRWLQGAEYRDQAGRLTHISAQLCCDGIGAADDALPRLFKMIRDTPAIACDLLSKLRFELSFRESDPTAQTFSVGA